MNEIKKIIVSYNTNEILIELELDKKNFEIFNNFIKILSEKTGEKDILNDFELMPVNTSVPYILIDENNFRNIIEEEIGQDNLKLFMNKKEKNEEEEENEIDSNENENNIENNIKNKNNDEDDFSDNEEEIINSKENINKDKGETYEENTIENAIKNEIFENKDNNEITIKKELDDIFENLNINNIEKNEIIENCIKNEIKKLEEIEEKPQKFEIKEKVRDRTRTVGTQINLSTLFHKKNNSDKKKSKKQKNIFENELCKKCNSPLLSKKIICLICSNTILCDNCAKKHEHPCLICKSNFLSSIRESFNFMSKQYNYEANNSNKKLKVNLSLFFYGDKDICLRPNKGVLLPVKIFNNTNNTTIFSNDIIFVVKGNKFLEITYDMNQKFKIAPNDSYILNLKCLTSKNLNKETINLEIFSNRYILKENKNNKISLNIEVNEDKEEEDLNLNLGYNELVILYNKEHKKLLYSLMENELKEYDVEQIIEILVQYNWNKEKFLKNFFKLYVKKE